MPHLAFYKILFILNYISALQKTAFSLVPGKGSKFPKSRKNSPEVPKSGQVQFGGLSRHPQRPFAYFFVCRQISLFIGFRLATRRYPLHSIGPADTMVSVSDQTFFQNFPRSPDWRILHYAGQ